MTVREAGLYDVEQMVSLTQAYRARQQEWQPKFWRTAPEAADLSRTWFAFLIDQGEAGMFVNQIDDTTLDGFLIATVIDAPPVYAPGGKSCIIDDYVLANDDLWPNTGKELLEAAKEWARAMGATQTIIVAPNLYDQKKAFLDEAGMSLASTWWVGEI